MTEQAVFINAGAPTPSRKRGGELQSIIPMLMALPEDDPSQGWRIIATYPGATSLEKGYRTAHARAQHIRAGRVNYFSRWGNWEAAARFMGDGMIGLYVRYMGRDGERRWAR